MRFRDILLGLILGTIGCIGQSAQSQDTGSLDQIVIGYPTTFDQCTEQTRQRQAVIQSLRQEISQCLRGKTSHPWIMIRVCEYPGSPTCAPIEEQACILVKESSAKSQLCTDRALEYQEQERERQQLENERMRIEDAAARDAERQQAAAARIAANAASRGDSRLANYVAGRYIDPAEPTHAAGRTFSDGMRISNLLGIPTSPAMRLSHDVSRIALDAHRRIGTGVLGEFDAAAGSGAFDVDAASIGGTSGQQGRAAVNVVSEYQAFQQEMQAYQDLWRDGGQVGQFVAAVSLAARIVDILNDPTNDERSDPARPSLVDGAYARNFVRLSEAAARGDVDLAGSTSPYTLVSRVATEPGADRYRAVDDVARREEGERARDDIATQQLARYREFEQEIEEDRRARLAAIRRNEEMVERERRAAELAQEEAEQAENQRRHDRAVRFEGSVNDFFTGLSRVIEEQSPTRSYDDPCPGPRCEVADSR